METSSFATPGGPPPLTPPPVITPPPAPKPRKSRGWMIFAVVLLVLLVVSLFGNFAQLFSKALTFNNDFEGIMHNVGPRLEECMLEDHHAASKIAVIRVEGEISDERIDQAGNSMVDIIRAQLDRARKDNRVKAVILKVNSPGGETLASDQIHRAIVRFEDQSAKPVICSMGSMAASGGYYISTPCRWIVADRLTLTGSIGVLTSAWNYRGLMDKVGVWPETFTTGKFKNMLSGERETNQIPAEEYTMMQNLVDEVYQQFKSVVEEGRKNAHVKNKNEGRALALDWVDYADGRVFLGTQAYKLGFVDQLGDFRDAVKRTQEIARINNANLVEYRQRYEISDFLHLFGQSEKAQTLKLDLGMKLPKLRTGELYFLPPTFEN